MPRILLLVFVLAEVNFRCAPTSACECDQARCGEPGETEGETEGEPGETEGRPLDLGGSE